MKKHWRTVVVAMTLAAASAAVAGAQTGTAEVVGVVVDQQGTPLAHATIIVTDADRRNQRRLTADERGRFTISGLIPGRYDVTAEANGFAPRRQENLALAPDERSTLRLALRQAPMPETLTLAEIAADLETSRTDVHQTIDTSQLENLPNRRRQPLALSELASGVTADPSTGAPSVMGLDAALNRYRVDGFERSDPLTGRPQLLVAQSGIEQFDVRINGYGAESGAAAGIFNVATRSGTNTFHGSVFDFFGDKNLNALRTIDGTAVRPPYRSNQFGAAAGGPLAADHTFFLANYEGERRTEGAGEAHRDMWLANADATVGGGLLRLQFADENLGGRRDTDARAAGVAFGAARSIVVNETRVQYLENRDRGLVAADNIDATRIQVADTLSIAGGRHAAKGGVDVLLDQNDVRLAGARNGAVSTDVHTYSAFLQDMWRAADAVTVDLGVRYDVQDFAAAMPRDSNNWAPRVGVAIRRGEHSVLRGGYGLFYGFTPAIIPAAAMTDFGAGRRFSVEHGFENAQVHHANIGMEWEKYRVGRAGISYLFARGTHLPTATTTGVYRSTGQSAYNGITVHGHVTRTAFSFDLAYTLAHLDERHMPGDNDHRHHLVASLVLDSTSYADARFDGLMKTLARHWSFSLIEDILSGAPNSTGTARLPVYMSFNPRAGRDVHFGEGRKLSLFWEAFNLTNRLNYTAYSNTLYAIGESTLLPNSFFGRTIVPANGRMMQLAARLSF